MGSQDLIFKLGDKMNTFVPANCVYPSPLSVAFFADVPIPAYSLLSMLPSCPVGVFLLYMFHKLPKETTGVGVGGGFGHWLPLTNYPTGQAGSNVVAIS